MTVPRVFRVADGGFLVELGHVELELAAAGVEPRTFARLAADGARVATFGPPRSYALDDYLYFIDVHHVQDGELRASLLGFARNDTTVSSRVILRGLTPVDALRPEELEPLARALATREEATFEPEFDAFDQRFDFERALASWRERLGRAPHLLTELAT